MRSLSHHVRSGIGAWNTNSGGFRRALGRRYTFGLTNNLVSAETGYDELSKGEGTEQEWKP